MMKRMKEDHKEFLTIKLINKYKIIEESQLVKNKKLLIKKLKN